MTFLIPLALAQATAPVDPRIAQTWTVAVAQGMPRGTIQMRRDGRFTMRIRDKRGKESRIQGRYIVGPAPQGECGALAKARSVRFFYDLASLGVAGMPKAQVEALKKQGKRERLGMQLYFVSEVPMLTDMTTAHFVPVEGKDAALRRLAKWKPF